MTNTTMTNNPLYKALVHVRGFHPEATKVAFFSDGRWLFTDEDHNPIKFSDFVDISFLEDCVDETVGDHAYSL